MQTFSIEENTDSQQVVQEKINDGHLSQKKPNFWGRFKAKFFDYLNRINILETNFYIISWPDTAWYPGWYLTIRGAESFHVYLWIAKDWSWTQDWYWQGLFFGSSAVAWSFFLLSHSIRLRNYQEMWHGCGQILWLFANLWWMEGELHDAKFPSAKPINNDRQLESGYMMMAAICWLGIYYFILKPFELLKISDTARLSYDDTGLQCRIPFFFQSWRQYENIHILFWLGKDCAWNLLIPVMWIFFLVPTLLIALDFVITSTTKKELMIERAHYTACFIWVCGNMVWAIGEFYFAQWDDAMSMGKRNFEARRTPRWWSSWLLFSAYFPIVILYIIWIPLTLTGQLPSEQEKHTPKKEEHLPEQQSPTLSPSSGQLPSKDILTEVINPMSVTSPLPPTTTTNTTNKINQKFRTMMHDIEDGILDFSERSRAAILHWDDEEEETKGGTGEPYQSISQHDFIDDQKVGRILVPIPAMNMLDLTCFSNNNTNNNNDGNGGASNNSDMISRIESMPSRTLSSMSYSNSFHSVIGGDSSSDSNSDDNNEVNNNNNNNNNNNKITKKKTNGNKQS